MWVLGAFDYHFWMADMKPIRRGTGDQYLHRTTPAYRAAVRRKLGAYHAYVQIGAIAQGLLLHLAINHTAAVWRGFWSWLRTMNPAMPPSELVVANALRSSLPAFLAVSDSVPGLEKIMTVYHRYNSPSEHWAATLAVE